MKEDSAELKGDNALKVQSVTYKRGYAQIVEQIIELIRSGELQPKDRLPSEREMAQLFDTSRPTVREAMSALELAGIVEVRVGKGVFVLGLDSWNSSTALADLESEAAPTDLLEVREILEPAAAWHAARRADASDFEAIEEALEECHRTAQEADASSFERADDRFHLAVSKATRNPVLDQFATEISVMRSGRLWRAMKQRLALEAPQLHRYCREHDAIYASIRDGNAEAASETAAKHLQTVRQFLLEGRGSGGESES